MVMVMWAVATALVPSMASSSAPPPVYPTLLRGVVLSAVHPNAATKQCEPLQTSKEVPTAIRMSAGGTRAATGRLYADTGFALIKLLRRTMLDNEHATAWMKEEM